MKAIWAEEEPEYHGEFVNFDKMKQWPKPIQKPHPPIIVGGAFPYAARRAIRYGDGWIPRDDWLEPRRHRGARQVPHHGARRPAAIRPACRSAPSACPTTSSA